MQTPLFIQSDSEPTTFLPVEFILSLKEALEEKQRLYEKLPAEIEVLAKRYAAAMVFAPPDFDPSKPAPKAAPAPATPPNKIVTLSPPKVAVKRRVAKPKVKPIKPMGWRKALQTILEDAADGMIHQSLLKLAREKHTFPPSSGEKGFYNAIAKLINAGSVVKHGNILFAASVYKKKKAADDLPSVPETQRRTGSSAELIRTILTGKPDGLTGPELRKILAAMPDAPKSLREHGQYVYNILGTMMGVGEVIKENSLYRLSTGGGK
jgi:hypothetical protein